MIRCSPGAVGRLFLSGCRIGGCRLGPLVTALIGLGAVRGCLPAAGFILTRLAFLCVRIRLSRIVGCFRLRRPGIRRGVARRRRSRRRPLVVWRAGLRRPRRRLPLGGRFQTLALSALRHLAGLWCALIIGIHVAVRPSRGPFRGPIELLHLANEPRVAYRLPCVAPHMGAARSWAASKFKMKIGCEA